MVTRARVLAWVIWSRAPRRAVLLSAVLASVAAGAGPDAAGADRGSLLSGSTGLARSPPLPRLAASPPLGRAVACPSRPYAGGQYSLSATRSVQGLEQPLPLVVIRRAHQRGRDAGTEHEVARHTLEVQHKRRANGDRRVALLAELGGHAVEEGAIVWCGDSVPRRFHAAQPTRTCVRLATLSPTGPKPIAA
jgi:hypothetical protein